MWNKHAWVAGCVHSSVNKPREWVTVEDVGRKTGNCNQSCTHIWVRRHAFSVVIPRGVEETRVMTRSLLSLRRGCRRHATVLCYFACTFPKADRGSSFWQVWWHQSRSIFISVYDKRQYNDTKIGWQRFKLGKHFSVSTKTGQVLYNAATWLSISGIMFSPVSLDTEQYNGYRCESDRAGKCRVWKKYCLRIRNVHAADWRPCNGDDKAPVSHTAVTGRYSQITCLTYL